MFVPALYKQKKVGQRKVWIQISRNERSLNAMKAHETFGDLHGCRRTPGLENQRPFGVDCLEQIFRANMESRLMERFQFHFRHTGWILEQVFLGGPAFGTVELANMEDILSSKVLNPWPASEQC